MPIKSNLYKSFLFAGWIGIERMSDNIFWMQVVVLQPSWTGYLNRYVKERYKKANRSFKSGANPINKIKNTKISLKLFESVFTSI